MHCNALVSPPLILCFAVMSMAMLNLYMVKQYGTLTLTGLVQKKSAKYTLVEFLTKMGRRRKR